MELYKIIQIFAGIFCLIAALTHMLFMFIDFRGGMWFYWMLEDPEEYEGLEGLVAAGLGALMALILSILHGICYFFVGLFLILFKRSKVMPILSIPLALIGIFLAIRVLVGFDYTSDLIIFHMIIDIIVIVISIFSLITPRNESAI